MIPMVMISMNLILNQRNGQMLEPSLNSDIFMQYQWLTKSFGNIASRPCVSRYLIYIVYPTVCLVSLKSLFVECYFHYNFKSSFQSQQAY